MNQLKDMRFNFTLKPDVVPGIEKITVPDLNLLFSDITLVKEYFGEYTPNNDSLQIAVVPTGMKPNFIFFVCDRLANLHATNLNNDYMFAVPVGNVFAYTALPGDANMTPNVFTIYASIGAFPAMPNGQKIKWYLLLVEGTITLDEA